MPSPVLALTWICLLTGLPPDGGCQFIHLCVRPDVRFPHDEKYRRPVLFQKAVPVHFFLIKRRVTIPRHKEQRNIRLFRCETCLFHAAFAQFALVAKSCRIYDNARAERMYLHRLVDRVGRRSRHIGDNGYLLSGKSVDECGFPAVCFSKYSYVQTAAAGVSFNVTAITFFSLPAYEFPLVRITSISGFQRLPDPSIASGYQKRKSLFPSAIS